MQPPRAVDVAAILTAVYRRPSEGVDQLAARVRSRLALLETVGECVRLLVEAPASALTSTLGTAPEQDERDEQESASDD